MLALSLGFSSCSWPRWIAGSDEAGGVYSFVAACDGKLTLFVNDSYGFYGSNADFANISLSRVN
ncbi:MAG: hypothetical protein IIC10_02935 [Proteobacteria bacterium]|nr:hypothetical protein [Pseudomonadota bacterium]